MKKQYAVVKDDDEVRQYRFTIFHPAKELAIDEAKRLSQKEGGSRFLILEVIGYAESKPFPIEYMECE